MIDDKYILQRTIASAIHLIEQLPQTDIVIDCQCLLNSAKHLTETLNTRMEVIHELKLEMLKQCDEIDKQALQLNSEF